MTEKKEDSYGAQAVPDGWRLVPEEPTPEWVSALGEAGVRIGAIEHVIHDVLAAAPQPPAAQPLIARALAEWHEDDGPVMWWAWCGHEWAGEPAYIGHPNCDDWPGYQTHWTPHPPMPGAARQGEGGGNG